MVIAADGNCLVMLFIIYLSPAPFQSVPEAAADRMVYLLYSYLACSIHHLLRSASSFHLQVPPSVIHVYLEGRRVPVLGGPKGWRAVAQGGFVTHFSRLLSGRTWGRSNLCTDRPFRLWQGAEPGTCNQEVGLQSPLTDLGRPKLWD